MNFNILQPICITDATVDTIESHSGIGVNHASIITSIPSIIVTSYSKLLNALTVARRTLFSCEAFSNAA